MKTDTSNVNLVDNILAGIRAAMRRSDLQQAGTLADAAVRNGLLHPVLFSTRAIWFENQSKFRDALADYRVAHTLAPHDSDILNALGLCLLRLNDSAAAIAAFDTAIAHQPESAMSHYRKGWALESTGNFALAKESYERAASLEPEHVDALSGLAVLEARSGNRNATFEYATRALQINPAQPTALVAMAMLDLAEKKYGEAEAKVRPLLKPSGLSGRARGVALGVLGDALDGQGRVSEAFATYVDENREFRRLNQSRFESGQTSAATTTLLQLIEYFRGPTAQIWRDLEYRGAPTSPPAKHVFLIGFPRSGTTLLEQVLASHPDAATLEEREILGDPAKKYLSSVDGLAELSQLSADDLARERDAYWLRIEQYGLTVQNKIFVDKLPLNTVKLPLIKRLFPTAKILLALRDPRDVVWSCFRRHFDTNAATFEFLTLEKTARFYDRVMSLLVLYRQTIEFDLHEHRYENMVSDFEGSVRAVCDFIGMEWDRGMRDFSRVAQSNEIRSPSAPQVRRELYSDGIGQWKRYTTQLAPVLPLLTPWVAKFGYQGN